MMLKTYRRNIHQIEVANLWMEGEFREKDHSCSLPLSVAKRSQPLSTGWVDYCPEQRADVLMNEAQIWPSKSTE